MDHILESHDDGLRPIPLPPYPRPIDPARRDMLREQVLLIMSNLDFGTPELIDHTVLGDLHLHLSDMIDLPGGHPVSQWRAEWNLLVDQLADLIRYELHRCGLLFPNGYCRLEYVLRLHLEITDRDEGDE